MTEEPGPGYTTVAYRVRRALGGYHPLVRWYRQHRSRWLWLRLHLLGRVTRSYVAQHGLTVRHGAFAGLEYSDEAIGRVGFLPAKLLGAYEPVVVEALSSMGDYDRFVDIGSGEGYYVIGMARCHPDMAIIGFETTLGERQLCQELAERNGVQIELRGTADHASLGNLPPGRTLLLVDVEGYEADLLDPERAPRLREMAMVVELHRNRVPDIDDLLERRFRETHDIRVLVAEEPDSSLYPELEDWDRRAAAVAMDDGRGSLGAWMVLQPR